MLCKSFATRLFAFSLIASAAGFLAGCEDSGLSPPTRSFAPVSPEALAAMKANGSSSNAPVLIRTYKKEAELEIWKMKPDGHYAFLKSFPMCRWSGQLGPKVREGDRQVPEGFYAITPARMNPNSAYYLSFDVGYPNAYDRAMGHTGGSIMVHGVCSSAGCFSMTDAQIAEIYAIAREAFAGGQHAIQMQSYPFRMTAENLAKYRLDRNIGFWNQLKDGSDNFEATKQDVVVGVCNKHYVFNAAPADGSHFDATSACPPLKRNAETQRDVEAKRKRDDGKIAELVAQGVRPVHTVYADGGQHQDFASLASYASRPEALAKSPVDIALNEGKRRKARVATTAKPGAVKIASNSNQSPSAKPLPPVTVAAAASEPAKPHDVSLFSMLWSAKPVEAEAQTPPLPSTETAVPQPAEVPLPPRRYEPTAAKPLSSDGRAQNSVAAPAQVAASPPAGAAAKVVALLRAGVSTIAEAGH